MVGDPLSWSFQMEQVLMRWRVGVKYNTNVTGRQKLGCNLIEAAALSVIS